MKPTTASNDLAAARKQAMLSAGGALALAATLVLTSIDVAASPSPAAREAEAVVQDTVDELFAAMRSNRAAIESDPARVQSIVREVVLPHVDLDTVARLVLGKHWRTASAEEKQRFQAEFETLLVRTYSGALADTVDAEVKVTGSAASDDGARFLVRSKVERDAKQPVDLAYRLEGADGRWRMVDIAIGGVSLVSTWRTEFGAEIGRNGLGALIDRLAKRNAAG